jgi:hypothetical protein
MRKFSLCLFLTALAVMPLATRAQADLHDLDGAVPRNIRWGLDLLRRDLFDEAEKQILSESRQGANGTMASVFRAARETEGLYQNFDVVSTQTITPRLRVLYLALEYEKSPRFLKFSIYRTSDGWVVLNWRVIDDWGIFETNPPPGASHQ